MNEPGAYRLLPLTFNKDGFTFTQIAREGGWCLYGKTKTGFKQTFYEVMRVLKHDGREIHGTKFEPSEYLPHSESWGRDGFSFSDLDRARSFLLLRASEPPKNPGTGYATEQSGGVV